MFLQIWKTGLQIIRFSFIDVRNKKVHIIETGHDT